MVDNERQYVITFREARRFKHAMSDARRRLRSAAHGDDSLLARVQVDALASQYLDLKDELEAYDRRRPARTGSWFLTFTGRRFWPLDPHPEDVCVEDVARGLSRIARYNGATLGEWGYSVAQHSVLASRVVPTMHYLMHDASEAYAGDIVTPIKRLLGASYADIEGRIMGAIAVAFGFALTDESCRDVKRADNILLATEVRDLVPTHVLYHEPPEEPLPTMITPWEPWVAEREFLERFEELRSAA